MAINIFSLSPFSWLLIPFPMHSSFNFCQQLCVYVSRVFLPFPTSPSTKWIKIYSITLTIPLLRVNFFFFSFLHKINIFKKISSLLFYISLLWTSIFFLTIFFCLKIQSWRFLLKNVCLVGSFKFKLVLFCRWSNPLICWELKFNLTYLNHPKKESNREWSFHKH